ncbi:hypothetical protein LBMAG46_35810 [Planctomycetia bacterium]|nr:hypothetical protein LBMAG46_35810 [Planctomycetia bacterium]
MEFLGGCASGKLQCSRTFQTNRTNIHTDVRRGSRGGTAEDSQQQLTSGSGLQQLLQFIGGICDVGHGFLFPAAFRITLRFATLCETAVCCG